MVYFLYFLLDVGELHDVMLVLGLMGQQDRANDQREVEQLRVVCVLQFMHHLKRLHSMAKATLWDFVDVVFAGEKQRNQKNNHCEGKNVSP